MPYVKEDLPYHDSMEKSAPTRVIIAIGSNHHANKAMKMGRQHLCRLLTDARHADIIETEAIGIPSGPFLNSLTTGYTDLCLSDLTARLKEIERCCGDRRELRREHQIVLDLDLLLYGEQRLHLSDWERPYIQALLDDLSRSTTPDTSSTPSSNQL